MRASNRGQAISLAIVLLSLVVLVVFAMARLGTQSLLTAREQLSSEQAVYAAEAGVAEALVELRENPKYPGGSEPIEFRGQSYTLEVVRGPQWASTGLHVPPGCTYILATGRSGSGAQREVGVLTRLKQPKKGAAKVEILSWQRF